MESHLALALTIIIGLLGVIAVALIAIEWKLGTCVGLLRDAASALDSIDGNTDPDA